MAIRKTHKRGHGQAAIYITLPSGATLRWENYRDVPLRELALQLRTTADSVEKCASEEPEAADAVDPHAGSTGTPSPREKETS
jgi:hypothetical protein